MPRRAPLPCEKSVSTFYCPSLSQTSTVGKVSSVKPFHKLSKNTASRKPTKTNSLQARNYQTTSAVSKTLPGSKNSKQTAKAQARSKSLCLFSDTDSLCSFHTAGITATESHRAIAAMDEKKDRLCKFRSGAGAARPHIRK